jgi:hypothetical protein
MFFQRFTKKSSWHFSFIGMSRFSKESAFWILQARFHDAVDFVGRPRASVVERTSPHLFSVLFPPEGLSGQALIDACFSHCQKHAEKVARILEQGRSVISWHAYVEATSAYHVANMDDPKLLEYFAEGKKSLCRKYGHAVLPDQLFYHQISEPDSLREAAAYLSSLNKGIPSPYQVRRILSAVRDYENQASSEGARWLPVKGDQHPSYIADEITRHLINTYSIQPAVIR